MQNIADLSAGKQDSAKPPKSSLALGDARINPFITSYRTEYAAPFASGARIRSPLRNKMLADVADLKEIYSSAFQRVGEYGLVFCSVDVRLAIHGPADVVDVLIVCLVMKQRIFTNMLIVDLWIFSL